MPQRAKSVAYLFCFYFRLWSCFFCFCFFVYLFCC